MNYHSNHARAGLRKELHDSGLERRLIDTIPNSKNTTSIHVPQDHKFLHPVNDPLQHAKTTMAGYGAGRVRWQMTREEMNWLRLMLAGRLYFQPLPTDLQIPSPSPQPAAPLPCPLLLFYHLQHSTSRGALQQL